MIEIEKRITKCRIWNKDLKTMDYDGGFLYDLYNDIDNDCKHICLNKFILDLESKFNLMWFTGMHDKQGKEIYEADIVKWKEQVGHDESVKNNEDIFGLVLWNREGCKFVISQMTRGIWVYTVGDSQYEHETQFYSYSGEEFNWDELEVIGNLFENTNLYGDLRKLKIC